MTTNHVQLNLDLDSDTGVKALLALASAFGGEEKTFTGYRPTPPLTFPGEKFVEAPDDSPTRDDDTVAEPEPPAPEEPKQAKAAVKRRRTRAQIEEDKAEGLEDAFQAALKEHPDLDVDTIRDMIRGNREAAAAETAAAAHAAEGGAGEPSSTPDQAVTTEGSEPAGTSDAFDPSGAEEQPTGVTPATSPGWNPPWAQ